MFHDFLPCPKESVAKIYSNESVSCLFAILCSFIFFEMKIAEMPNEQLLMVCVQY